MPMRTNRILNTGFYCDADDTRVLLVLPVWGGEDLGSLSVQLSAMSLPTTVDQSGNAPVEAAEWIGPWGMLEHNIYALWVPFEVVATLTPAASQDAVPGMPQKDADWERLFRRLLFEWGTEGNEYYGANPIAGDTAEYDPVQQIWKKTRSGTSDDDNTDEPFDVLNTGMGPHGVRRLFSAENMLVPMSVQSLQTRGNTFVASILGRANMLSQFGVTDMVFADQMMIDLSGPTPGPGYVIVGVVRYDTGDHVDNDTENLSSFIGNYGGSGNQAEIIARNRLYNELVGGDNTRLQASILQDFSYRGQFLRSILFGGDVNLRSFDLNVDDSGEPRSNWWASLWQTGSGQTLRKNRLIYHMKGNARILTPYHCFPQW